MSDNKTVAVIHWQDGGVEKKAHAYSIEMLYQTIEWAERNNKVCWVCLTRLNTIIPVRSHKPVTAISEPVEYVGKVMREKDHQRAFTELTRIEHTRYPPTMEQVKKAYGH